MKHIRWLGLCVLALAMSVVPAIAADPNVPPDVLAQKPTDTIPVGTKISAANWQQYSEFMPYFLKNFFSGKHGVPVSAAPNQVFTITAPAEFPLPKVYLQDTEKYSGQVNLVASPPLGLDIKGYVAGIPFPNPTEPNRGMKIAYDTYFHFVPAFVFVSTYGPTTDRYGATTWTGANNMLNRLNYVSDPEFPGIHNRTPGNAFWRTEYFELTAPEQSRYTGVLQMFPSDPVQTFESFTYIPALRRSLRVSAAARCTPSAGSDSTLDDNDGGAYIQYPLFDVKYHGTAKILTLGGLDPEVMSKGRTSDWVSKEYDITHMSFPTPMNPGATMQLREVYIIDATRLPSSPGYNSYCYGDRVIYTDKTWFVPWGVDMFDREGNFWKAEPEQRAVVTTPWGEKTWLDTGLAAKGVYDFQQRHFQCSTNYSGYIDSQAPLKYHDISRYTTPGGLDQIEQ